MEKKQTIIELTQLGKVFQTKDGSVSALENIDLQIYEGEIFGIIGMSGAGKSTLVRCINFLEKPTSGEVIFDGQKLSQLTEKELRAVRRSMGMIFQQFNLLMQRTAFQNICFPLEIAGMEKSAAKERAEELLEIVGLSDKRNVYPSQLSGGQKQRVAIARALATKPKVLLCDEATSALDPSTTQSILALIKDINRRLGITIIVITHEMSVIEEICQRVAIIDDSKIAEIGTVEEIFTRPKSAAGRKFFFPGGAKTRELTGDRCIRVVFDGGNAYEPVIANMILECKVPVNILFGDIKNIDDKSFGHLVLQIPDDERTKGRIVAYLQERNLTVEEVIENV
ncbi:MAG: ATP-binding cassette domain-containing protein [Eubacteriaceae bacterium]|jgi:D-methionine transport system ATP-binding protein|nr:ATP-binding cassette domain-containing protein [Eubacteriaceae bacterium]